MTPIFKFQTQKQIIFVGANNLDAAIAFAQETSFVSEYGSLDWDCGCFNTCFFTDIMCIDNAAIVVESWYI